eukprot:7055297-Pyramimonas_sp.AAC.1
MFVVRECDNQSAPRPQHSRISQDCTLSPLLFALVMTVLLHDVASKLTGGAKEAHVKGDLSECVYADDTLLIGSNEEHLNELLGAVASAGKRYGMELHWG